MSDKLNSLPAVLRKVGTLPESDCHRVLDTMAARHGWTFALWTRTAVLAALRATPVRPAAILGRREWERIMATNAWAAMPREAYAAVDAACLIETAIKEAGLICDNCDEPLYQPPTITGRLCDRCRRGPHGQSAPTEPANGCKQRPASASPLSSTGCTAWASRLR